MLQVISGPDPRDSTSIQDAPPLTLPNPNQTDLKGLRVGVIAELDSDAVDSDVLAAFHQSIDTLKSLGASVSSVSLPSTQYAVPVYYIIATAEASSNLARFDGVRYGRRADNPKDILDMYKRTRAQYIGPEVKRRILLGTFSLSSGYYDAYYGKAQKTKELMRREFAQAWQQYDLLICPTSPTTAFKIGEKASDPVSMYLSDIATIPVNLVGIPALSVPCGFDGQGLPVGLQLLAPHLREDRLLQVAKVFETATGYKNLEPTGIKQTATCPA
jgi:aspartyl-tRNA(Asn)/glutamyl-tRNA(Gln) amidotransferase subunit A